MIAFLPARKRVRSVHEREFGGVFSVNILLQEPRGESNCKQKNAEFLTPKYSVSSLEIICSLPVFTSV